MVGKAYLSRGALLWVAARAIVGVLFVAFSASPLHFPRELSVALVALVSVLSYVELRRHHEGSLLHNLGVPVMIVIAISTLPAIVGESAIRLAQSISR